MNFQTLLNEWTVFGPIDNPGAFPGPRAWKPLPGDGLTKIPSRISIDNLTCRPRRVVLGRGRTFLNFRKIFGTYPEGSPQCYAFCEFKTDRDTRVRMGLDSDWAAVIWLDGKEILESRAGSLGPVGSFVSRRHLTIPKGRHLLCCRIISGTGGWTLSLAVDPVRKEQEIQRYGDTGLRLEVRPLPTGRIGNLSTPDYEKIMAACGVEARWISVVDQSLYNLSGNAVYKSRVFPAGKNYRKEFDKNLTAWVKTIHGLGLPVLSWYPMIINRQVWLEHPEWRQKFLVKFPAGKVTADMSCCIHSPYGKALAKFCIEAIRKFDLDGIWFDGAFFSPTSEVPPLVGCVCRFCREKYREETGELIPDAFTPEKPEFRRWIDWRYKAFAGYWKYLTDEIKSACPKAEIAVNHYHRENIGWNGAVPLNPFPADIISASEADGEPWKGAFYTRLMRAYGRPRTEVWITASVGLYQSDGRPAHNPYPLITEALACLTAGGDPSFGGLSPMVSAGALAKLAEQIRCRKPYRNLPSIPLVALHVSQQTATYTFGCNPNFITSQWKDEYWKSLVGWDGLLMMAGVWTDCIFDDHLKTDFLRKYAFLVMPYTVALSQTQIAAILDYVRGGGTLITGRWFAAQDEWGYPLARPFSREFPGYGLLSKYFEISQYEKKQTVVRKYHKGRIVQTAGDPGWAFRDRPSSDGVKRIQELLSRDKKKIPIRFKSPGGKETFVHLGVFNDKAGNTIVCIQQIPAPWMDRDIYQEEPLVVAGGALIVELPGTRQAEALLPAPGFSLELIKRGSTQQINLPPFTWGTVIRLK